MASRYPQRGFSDEQSRKLGLSELKLRRLQELNVRLREDYERDTAAVSDASIELIDFCSKTRDFMVPALWGAVDKKDNPYLQHNNNGNGPQCCTIV